MSFNLKRKEKKAVSSASTGEIWLIPEDFDSRVLYSPALPMSVVGYGCELSAQGDCDVGVERPPGHQGGVVQIVETVHSLPLP